ncbi:uncharacterized protein LOC144196549 isoform X2 [Stigmatopora nigra]
MWRRGRGSEALERAQALLQQAAERKKNRGQRTPPEGLTLDAGRQDGQHTSDASQPEVPTAASSPPSSSSSGGVGAPQQNAAAATASSPPSSSGAAGRRFVKKGGPVHVDEKGSPRGRPASTRTDGGGGGGGSSHSVRGSRPVKGAQNVDGDEEESAKMASEYHSGSSSAPEVGLSPPSIPSFPMDGRLSPSSISPSQADAHPSRPSSPDTSSPREVPSVGEGVGPGRAASEEDGFSDSTGGPRTAGDGEASFPRDDYESDFESEDVTPSSPGGRSAPSLRCVSERPADEDGVSSEPLTLSLPGDAPRQKDVWTRRQSCKDAAAQTDGRAATALPPEELRRRLVAARRSARDARRERDRALGPPDYTYATLQDAMEMIRRAKACHTHART